LNTCIYYTSNSFSAFSKAAVYFLYSSSMASLALRAASARSSATTWRSSAFAIISYFSFSTLVYAKCLIAISLVAVASSRAFYADYCAFNKMNAWICAFFTTLLAFSIRFPYISESFSLAFSDRSFAASALLNIFERSLASFRRISATYASTSAQA